MDMSSIADLGASMDEVLQQGGGGGGVVGVPPGRSSWGGGDILDKEVNELLDTVKISTDSSSQPINSFEEELAELVGASPAPLCTPPTGARTYRAPPSGRPTPARQTAP